MNYVKSYKATNVILISFDTLRQDFLSCYGYPKPLSPNLDQLADEGVIFTDAVVNCGWTLPQHISMITGTHPLKHKVIYLRKRCSLPTSIKTLAELFRQEGYVTFGFANTNPYGGGNWGYGFYRGMYYYNTLFPLNNMMELLPEVLLGTVKMAGPKPFFIYIHVNDTHEPFAANKPFASKWGSGYVNRYEGEVSYVDHYFGIILKEIEKRGLKDNTLVVATSDHGTEFLEHEFQEKKLNLYEEISRVPLIFSLPSFLPQGKKIEGLCETIDIAPTLLDMCDLSIPDWMDGKSLYNRISGEGKPSKYVIAHTLHDEGSYGAYDHFSIRNERYKFIRTRSLLKYPMELPGTIGERFRRLNSVAEFKNGFWRELYDLKKDSLEKKNIISSIPLIANKLEEKLAEYIFSFNYTEISKVPTKMKKKIMWLGGLDDIDDNPRGVPKKKSS